MPTDELPRHPAIGNGRSVNRWESVPAARTHLGPVAIRDGRDDPWKAFQKVMHFHTLGVGERNGRETLLLMHQVGLDFRSDGTQAPVYAVDATMWLEPSRT